MKKDYTLKLVLAMLVVVLVSLVSFVGIYKGQNLIKDYSLGKDFGRRKIAVYSVTEKTTTDGAAETATTEQPATENAEGENSENATESNGEGSADNSSENVNVQPVSEQDKVKDYNKAKNNIIRRLTAMKSEEFDIRLDEGNGKLVIEVPETMDSTFLANVVSKGKVEIKNSTTSEVIAEGNVFRDASAALKTQTYSNGMQQITKKMVVLNLKLTKEAKKKIVEANTVATNNGTESEAEFSIVLDGEQLYTDSASTFIESAQKNNGFELYMGQSDEGEELDKDYQVALAKTAIIKCGEIPVEYNIESLEIVSSSIDVKIVAIVAVVVGVLLLAYAIYKFRLKGVLPVISLVGLVASILLVLRYTNVKFTLFSVLAIAVILLASYAIIIKTLSNKKSFMENFIKVVDVLVPVIIVAIVFCCSPYMQLASFGMTMFWGLIVMSIYNLVIVRTFINK